VFGGELGISRDFTEFVNPSTVHVPPK